MRGVGFALPLSFYGFSNMLANIVVVSTKLMAQGRCLNVCIDIVSGIVEDYLLILRSLQTKDICGGISFLDLPFV